MNPIIDDRIIKYNIGMYLYMFASLSSAKNFAIAGGIPEEKNIVKVSAIGIKPFKIPNASVPNRSAVIK